MSRNTVLKIDISALQQNLKRVREITPKSKILAMIKANAYGHGIVQVAKALHAADALGVACIEEGIQLREAGIKAPIVLVEGFLHESELALIEQYNFAIVVHQKFQLEILEEQQLAAPVNVWLKIDSGMHRLGFKLEDSQNAWQRLQACNNVCKDIITMTHFANADDLQSQSTSEQLAAFYAVSNVMPSEKSLANSAAILAWPETHAEWVRPGIMLYGVSPFVTKSARDLDLTPVMTFSSEIIAIRHLLKGSAIGYGSTWHCPEDMLVGVVAVGYGDGYPRRAPNGTPLLVNNQRTQLVGRVSMDMLTVDLRPCANVNIGDKVTLWGNNLPVEEIAKTVNAISYELLLGVTGRVPKVYQ